MFNTEEIEYVNCAPVQMTECSTLHAAKHSAVQHCQAFKQLSSIRISALGDNNLRVMHLADPILVTIFISRRWGRSTGGSTFNFSPPG